MQPIGVLCSVVAYACLYPGLYLPAVEIKGTHGSATDGSRTVFVDVSRSTIDGVKELYERKFYFAAGVIFIFSIVMPSLKLLVILNSLCKPYIKIRENEYLDTRRLVRAVSKFQMVDLYIVGILTAFLNNTFIQAQLLPGFYCFLMYCVFSVLGIQFLDTNPHYIEAHRSASALDRFFLVWNTLMFTAGFIWSLALPVLTVRYVFQSKIVFAESSLSLLGVIKSINASGNSPVAALFLILVCLAPIIRFWRGFQLLWRGGKIRANFGDWAQLDVFALALTTSIFIFNSFDAILRATVPWGFYSTLMAGMSFWEISSKLAPPFITPGYNYLPVVSRDSESSDAEDGPNPPERSHSGLSSFGVVLRVVQGLGLPFFILKAAGWAIFFAVWYLNSSRSPLNLREINSTLTSNLPLVTVALADVVPNQVGGGKLYYEKGTATEVLARYLDGLKTVKVLNMEIESSKGDLVMRVSGSFDKIQLSLFIGQCLTPDNFFREKQDIPVCDQVFDSLHSWTDVKWSLQVNAACSSYKPFVRNLALAKVTVDTPMNITENILGMEVNVDDLGKRFKQGIQAALQPLMESKDQWIPWGEEKFDLMSLLSHVVSLNTYAGEDRIQCPDS